MQIFLNTRHNVCHCFGTTAPGMRTESGRRRELEQSQKTCPFLKVPFHSWD